MGKEPRPLIWFARSDDIAMSAAAGPQTGPDVAVLTDPKNLENPQAQLRALRELEINHQSSGDFSAEQWQAMTAKYKALTKLTDTPGTVWTRDSTYAGLWAKGTERAIVQGQSLGREVLDQAAGLAAENGVAGEAGVGAAAAAAKGVVKAGVMVGALKKAIHKVDIPAGKFDYLFGKVTSNSHNAARSNQLAAEMKRLGVPDTAAGRQMLTAHFEKSATTQGNVIHSFSNEYGKFEVRESLFIGPSGKAINLQTTFHVLEDGTRRLSTVIPIR
jgi:hypothetical protein